VLAGATSEKHDRLNEAAQVSWPEVQGDVIIFPASRMKGREGKAREHLVPLSSAAQEVIASLPRIKNASLVEARCLHDRDGTSVSRRRDDGGPGLRLYLTRATSSARN
jgi:hypothetical protein